MYRCPAQRPHRFAVAPTTRLGKWAVGLVGGADLQDPVTNLSDLKQHFPDSRTVIFPRIGHEFGIGGCAAEMMADVVERVTTKGLDTTRCDGAVVVPPFELTD